MSETTIVLPQPLQVQIATGNPTLESAVAQLQAQLGTLQQILESLGDGPELDPDLAAIAQLPTTEYGRGLLEVASAEAGRDYLLAADVAVEATVAGIISQIGTIQQDLALLAGSQPGSATLTALSQTAITEFGRSLLELADAAELQALVSAGAGADISELSYTPTQSSVYDAPGTANLGTYANLTNNNNQNGAGTLNGATEGPQWIKADLGTAKNILSLTVAGGFLPAGFEGVANYLNGAQVQVSSNDSDWEVVTLVAGASNSSLAGTTNAPIPVAIPIHRKSRYIRLYMPGSWLGTTEFRVRGW